jgi:hypothetical protein
MTDKERKLLEGKRQQLEMDKAASIAKANQATGAIAMIDSMLAMPDEQPAPANGHDQSEGQQLNG